MESARKTHARHLFSPLGPTYHRVGAALSFGQDPLWRRYLVERIRTERSVLLVPGEMFGIDNGIRFGFGFDVEHTLKGLALAGDTIAAVAANG